MNEMATKEMLTARAPETEPILLETLTQKVDLRIAFWMEAIQDVPDEYSPEAWQKIQDIRETLNGLFDIKIKFCLYLDPDEPEDHKSVSEDWLY